VTSGSLPPTATATPRLISPATEVALEAEAVAAAVRGCPSVAGLAAGSFGEAATYLPGKRVLGVRMTSDRLDIHVVARYGVPIPVLAAEVRAALARLARGRAVDIRVEDLWMPPPAPA
jgi:hypothetical protein